MGRMSITDPRVDTLREADPLLKYVGPGTIEDVLKAAEKTGIIPVVTGASQERTGLRHRLFTAPKRTTLPEAA